MASGAIPIGRITPAHLTPLFMPGPVLATVDTEMRTLHGLFRKYLSWALRNEWAFFRWRGGQVVMGEGGFCFSGKNPPRKRRQQPALSPLSGWSGECQGVEGPPRETILTCCLDLRFTVHFPPPTTAHCPRIRCPSSSGWAEGDMESCSILCLSF